MEILLLAPGLFSTTTGWPSRSDNHGAMIRETMSAPPPAGNPSPAQRPRRIGLRAGARRQRDKGGGRARQAYESSAMSLHSVSSECWRHRRVAHGARRRPT
jgi:hypothetical protein